MLSLYFPEARNAYPNVICYYHHTYKDFTMALHSHKRMEIMYVEYGELTVKYYEDNEKKTLTLFSRDYVVIDADVKHTIIVPDVSTRIINLEISLSPEQKSNIMTLQGLIDIDRNVRDFFNSSTPIVKLSDSNNLAQLLLIIQENLDKNADLAPTAFIDFSLAAMLIQISQDFRTQQHPTTATGIKYLRKSITYIQTHYQLPISSADIAKYTDVSQNYLNVLFKKNFGQTIIDYLNSYRISKAKIIIEKSTIPYSTIFNHVGYRTKQNFNKNFIRYAGMTPREYRIKMRTKNNTHWTQSSDEKQIYYQENSEE